MAGAKEVEALGRKAVPRVPRDAAIDVGGAGHAKREIGAHPLDLGHMRHQAQRVGDPAGVAHVVGMEMGHDRPCDRAPAERRAPDLAPQFLGLVVAIPGIEKGPAVAVLEEIEIDVIELERQRHANPMDAGRDRHRRSRLGKRLERIVELDLGQLRHVVIVPRPANAAAGHDLTVESLICTEFAPREGERNQPPSAHDITEADRSTIRSSRIEIGAATCSIDHQDLVVAQLDVEGRDRQ